MGKVLEKCFLDSAKQDNVWIYRIKDNSQSFDGNTKSSFSTPNICDFFLFGGVENGKGNLIGLELKSSKYTSFSIQRTPNDPIGMVKAAQINSLIQLSLQEGIIAGFIFNFRNDNTNEQVTAFLSIQNFSNFLVSCDKKSINLADIKEFGGIKVEQTLKRKYYTFDVKKMVEEVVKQNTKI